MSDVDVQVADRIATVTIDRPAQRNAVTLAMWREIGAVFARLSGDVGIRGIVLTGAGGNFSAGADIAEFGAVRDDAAQALAYEAAIDDCADAIAAARPPTIAALPGYCLGGACHLALACDFRVGDATTRVGIPAARLSIVYGVRATQRLHALVGLSAAKRILFAAERLDAAEALRLGVLDRLGASALDEALALAATMADNAPISIAGAKTILNGLAMGPGALDVSAADRLIGEAAGAEDYREGRAAFAAKRRPDFTGR